AAANHMEIVPSLFAVGYSNDMLWHDPNLAEGLPVKDQAFVVKAGEAPPERVVRFPAKVGFKDDAVQMEGGEATVSDNAGVARFTYQLKLPPFHRYHVSVKIKTQDYTG